MTDLNKHRLNWALWYHSPSLHHHPRPGLMKAVSPVLSILLLKIPECFAIMNHQITPCLLILLHDFNGAASIARHTKRSSSLCLVCKENIKVVVLSLRVSTMTQAFNCTIVFHFTNNTRYNTPFTCWVWCRPVTACNRFLFLHSRRSLLKYMTHFSFKIQPSDLRIMHSSNWLLWKLQL